MENLKERDAEMDERMKVIPLSDDELGARWAELETQWQVNGDEIAQAEKSGAVYSDQRAELYRQSNELVGRLKAVELQIAYRWLQQSGWAEEARQRTAAARDR